VTVIRRVVRSSSVTPSRASSSPMMRETDGCDRPSSRPARKAAAFRGAHENRQFLQPVAHLKLK